MGVKFDWETLDIFIDLTMQEAESLKRKPYATPSLEFQIKDVCFNLINPEFKGFITVLQPRTLSYNQYWIKISDEAYQQLLRERQIGDRYDGTHKIDIRIEQ